MISPLLQVDEPGIIHLVETIAYLYAGMSGRIIVFLSLRDCDIGAGGMISSGDPYVLSLKDYE